MKNTMNDLLEKQIAETIKAKEASLKASRDALRQLHAMNKKPFVATRFGRGYTHVIEFITRPFATAHKASELALTDPEAFQFYQYKFAITQALKRAKKIPNNEHKNAKDMAITLAKLKMAIDQFGSRFEEVQELGQALAAEVERLRPPMTDSEKAAMSDIINKMASNLGNLAKNIKAESSFETEADETQIRPETTSRPSKEDPH